MDVFKVVPRSYWPKSILKRNDKYQQYNRFISDILFHRRKDEKVSGLLFLPAVIVALPTYCEARLTFQRLRTA